MDGIRLSHTIGLVCLCIWNIAVRFSFTLNSLNASRITKNGTTRQPTVYPLHYTYRTQFANFFSFLTLMPHYSHWHNKFILFSSILFYRPYLFRQPIIIILMPHISFSHTRSLVSCSGSLEFILICRNTYLYMYLWMSFIAFSSLPITFSIH